MIAFHSVEIYSNIKGNLIQKNKLKKDCFRKKTVGFQAKKVQQILAGKNGGYMGDQVKRRRGGNMLVEVQFQNFLAALHIYFQEEKVKTRP